MRMPQSDDPAIHERKHAVIARIRLVIGSVWSANRNHVAASSSARAPRILWFPCLG
jgi:hypothetical protein